MQISLSLNLIPFSAFVLFLLISISTPVRTQYHFLSYTFNDQVALKVGLWGSCTWDIDGAGSYTNKNCTRNGLGTQLDLSLLPGRNASSPVPLVLGSTSNHLIMFPIASSFAFAATILGPCLPLLLLPTGIVSGALVTAATVLSHNEYKSIDRQIHAAFPDVNGGTSNALKMAIAGTVFAWLTIASAGNGRRED